jgi:hypothetical protein
MTSQYPGTHRRELFVTVVLALVLGAGAFFYLFLITGGLFLAVLAAVGAMAIVGLLHYVIWGRQMPPANRAPDSPAPPMTYR